MKLSSAFLISSVEHDARSLTPGFEDRGGIPRPVEAIAAALVLLVSAPIIFVAAFLVKLTSRGPWLFRQERVGQWGRVFTLFKIRTMSSQTGGTELTSSGDPRVTPVGRVLRKTKLDELPQLWNVLRGEMSLVGPRPEVACYVDPQIHPEWQRVLRYRPGMTDPVTLLLRNEEAILGEIEGDSESFYRETLQPFKLRGYLDYLHGRNWRSDLRALWSTAAVVVTEELWARSRSLKIRDGQFENQTGE
jgi:lipopolysaccharide/colanic/teichoic acid biosynthesis glycosyltransferase